MDDPSPVDPKYVVTLVHGTFARGPEWVRPRSKLRRHLERALDGSVMFRAFAWSGTNSHEGRLRAGRELQVVLQDAYRQHPHARHYVVAHSHGGNVVLYALRDAQLHQRLSGVVCLATPFLTCDTRSIEDYLGVLRITLAFVLGFAILLLLGRLLSVFEDILGEAGAGLGLLILLFPVRRGVLWISEVWMDNLSVWCARHTRRIQERLETPHVRTVPLLALRHRGDEAGLWLGFLQRMADVPYRLASTGSHFRERWGPTVFVLALMVGLPLSLAASDARLLFVLLVAIATVLPLLALFPFLVALPIVVRGHSAGFGREGVLDNLLVRIWARSLPANVRHVELFTSSSSTVPPRPRRWSLFQRRLIHSLAYEDDRTLETAAAWIRKTSVGALGSYVRCLEEATAALDDWRRRGLSLGAYLRIERILRQLGEGRIPDAEAFTDACRAEMFQGTPLIIEHSTRNLGPMQSLEVLEERVQDRIGHYRVQARMGPHQVVFSFSMTEQSKIAAFEVESVH